MKKMFIFFLVLSCILTFKLNASCPEINIANVVEERDESSLLALVEELQTCEKWQDSLGLVYHTLGVYYYLNDDYDKAIAFTLKAIEVREILFAENPFRELGQSYYNLGVFYQDELKYYEAKEAFERSLEAYQTINDKEWEYNVLLVLSGVYTFFGDYEKSETALQFIISDAGKDNAFSRAEAFLNLSNLYLERERYRESLQLSQQAAPIFADSESAYNYAASLLNSVIALDKLGEYSESIRLGQEALTLYRDFKDDYFVCLLSSVLAMPLIRQDRMAAAEKMLQLGLQKSKDNDFKNLEAIIYDNYGEWYLKKEEYQLAAAAFEQSILLHLPEAGSERKLTPELRGILRQTSTKHNLFIAIYDYSRAALAVYAANGDHQVLQKALDYLRIGDVVVDQLRYDHTSEATKLFWREKVRPFYEKAMAICYELQDTRSAFYFLEKSKAILLLEALLASEAQEALPDSLQQQLRFIQSRISSHREDLSYLEGNDRKQTLEAILELEKQLSGVEENIIVQYPQYRSIIEQNTIVDINAFRDEYLAEATNTFVHYSYGQEELYALVIDQLGERFIKLGDSDKIEPLIQQLLSFFTAADKIGNQPADFLKQSFELYEILLAPLQLKEATNLLVVPDGTLAYLPFEALAVAAAANLSNASYLLEKHLLTYAFSATLFQQMCTEKKNASGEVLAFAPFAQYTYRDYANLRFSENELEAIDEQFSVHSFENESATLANFRMEQDQYSVLHLSTHAFSSFEKYQPRIIFADSTLFLSDLYQMRIPANLVVLSACQSNIGELAAGEGVLGLGRGFCFAGANSIIASLWNLNDKHTSSIITDFYDFLASGAPKALALRDAKLNFINNPDLPAFQKSPYYWAGLTYYGDDGTVELSTKNAAAKYLLIGSGLLLVLSGLFFMKWFSRKNNRS